MSMPVPHHASLDSVCWHWWGLLFTTCPGAAVQCVHLIVRQLSFLPMAACAEELSVRQGHTSRQVLRPADIPTHVSHPLRAVYGPHLLNAHSAWRLAPIDPEHSAHGNTSQIVSPFSTLFLAAWPLGRQGLQVKVGRQISCQISCQVKVGRQISWQTHM